MFEQASEIHSTDILFLALFTSIGENNSSWPGNFFGTKIIWVPVPSHFRDQTYLSPSPVPLLGPKLFESRSRPVFGTKLIWVPVPSRFRDQTYLSPSPVPLTGPERAESRSRRIKAGPAELCCIRYHWSKYFRNLKPLLCYEKKTWNFIAWNKHGRNLLI